MTGKEAIAKILKLEGTEYLFCFPANAVIDACAAEGIRPILTRTERTLVNMADGYTRVSNGRRLGVAMVQNGPGSENAFAGLAQAFSDSVPLLYMPGGGARRQLGVPPHFEAVPNYRGVTKWAANVNFADRIPGLMRRAFTLLRNGRSAPVLLEVPTDVMSEEFGDTLHYTPPRAAKSAGDPRDVREAARLLLHARRPVLHVGQGVLYAEATEELRALAEMVQAPVLTTMSGKSAFPENHPLALGTTGHTGTQMAGDFLSRADLVFGIGCSFTRTVFAAPIPPGKTLVQVTHDELDLNKDHAVECAVIGDAKLVLQQLIEEVKSQGGAGSGEAVREELRGAKEAWLREWMPKLTSEETPLNPYRVIWDLQSTVDRARTIVTHDSGNPRDQILPFWETLAPRGYLGWGKSTQLGYSLGLAMGAKLAAPEKLVITVMGDAAFGMCGMDLETAARERIPVLVVLLNNSALGGYEKHLPVATERYRTKYISGEYAKVAEGLGAYAERVTQPREIVPALQRAIAQTEEGRPALVEFITREEGAFSKPW